MRFRIELIDYRCPSGNFSPEIDDLRPVYRLSKNDSDIFGEWETVCTSVHLDRLEHIAKEWSEFKTINI